MQSVGLLFGTYLSQERVRTVLPGTTSTLVLGDNLEAAMAAHHETLSKAQSFTAADIWLWRAYKDRLVNDLSQAREHERVLAQEVHQRRAELVQKAKDRKLLDKLKEKQGIRHELEERLREQSVYDEMATLRHQPQAV